jgi:hypothetical protein
MLQAIQDKDKNSARETVRNLTAWIERGGFLPTGYTREEVIGIIKTADRLSEGQPHWALIANLGDVNPIDHGGYFVYRDKTGVYCEEAELLESPDDDEDGTWRVYRFPLDVCTFTDGILSDNPYHPSVSAWFAQPESEHRARPQDTTYLSNVAECVGTDSADLTTMFCSTDPLKRAEAYRAVGEYHGFDNLDSDPIEFTDRKDIEGRYETD